MPMSRLRLGLAVASCVVVVLQPGRVGAQALAPAPPSQPQTGAPQAPAASAAATLPAARTILDAHIKAIGGREAVLSHSSTHATGTITMESAGMTGTLEIFAAKPNRTVVKMTLGGIGEVTEGFDGTTAWTISPMSGPMIVQGKELEQKKFDADFYGELHAPEKYDSMKTVEKTVFDGRPCYKVSLIRKGGGEDIQFYDMATGLKAGGIVSRDTAMGTITATSIEADYKKFGNIMHATTVRQSAMGVQTTLKLSTVEYDTVDPKVFEPPAQIKALIK
ncbi:MAG: hypothetical protein LC804_14460 [Acidobacteria bacterium]|nr:hypothetical protein [Acidobacteriota bacterium]